MLPFADTRATQIHLDKISRHVAASDHAVVLMDRAGWHGTDKPDVPKNLTIILLPPCSPKLNPVDKVRQYLRHNNLDQHERVGSYRPLTSAVGIMRLKPLVGELIQSLGGSCIQGPGE